MHHFPYKIHLVQALHREDKHVHLEYIRAFINLTENEENFISNFMMSDEAHFHLNGFVNKQNCRFWGSANPRIAHQRPLHPAKVTVWCVVIAEHIIGPYFFEDHDGVVQTINAEHCRTMIENVLMPQLPKDYNMWFQQDAPWPTPLEPQWTS